MSGHHRIPNRPWSSSLEIAAAERRKAIARNERLDDYDELCYGDFDELLWKEFFYIHISKHEPFWGLPRLKTAISHPPFSSFDLFGP